MLGDGYWLVASIYIYIYICVCVCVYMKVPLGDDVSSGIIETWCDVLVVVGCWD